MSEPGESEALRAFRAVYEEANRAWNEGDFKRAYGGLPDDVVYHLGAAWLNARPLRGPTEIISFFEDWHETFPETHAKLHEFIQTGERTIVVGFEVSGTGGLSGASVAMEIWQVFDFNEAMLPVRLREFPDRESAIQAAVAGEPAAGES